MRPVAAATRRRPGAGRGRSVQPVAARRRPQHRQRRDRPSCRQPRPDSRLRRRPPATPAAALRDRSEAGRRTGPGPPWWPPAPQPRSAPRKARTAAAALDRSRARKPPAEPLVRGTPGTDPTDVCSRGVVLIVLAADPCSSGSAPPKTVGPPGGYTRPRAPAHAARRAQPHLSRVLRAHRHAAVDQQGPARQRRVRLLEHRAARLPGRAAGPRHLLLRRAGRSFRADSTATTRRTRRPTPDDLRDQFPIVRETLAAFRIPIYELAGLRGGRPHRHAHRSRRRSRASTRSSSRATWTCSSWCPTTRADDDAHGRRSDDHVRPGPHPRALRPDAAPDDRLQGAQGRHDRQHPGPRRASATRPPPSCSRTTARSTASSRIWTRSSRTSCARSWPEHRTTCCCWRDLVTIERDAPGRAGPRGARAWATTTGRRSSACSGSTSSGRSWSGCPRVDGRGRRGAGRPAARGGPQAGAGPRRAASPAPRAVARVRGEAERAAAEPRLRCRGGARGHAGRGDRRHRPRSRPRLPQRPSIAATADPGRLARLLGDPGLRRALRGRGTTRAAGWRPRPELTVGAAFDDLRPRRGTLLGLAVAGTDGRHRRRPMPRARPRLAASWSTRQARSSATRSSRCSSGSWRGATRRPRSPERAGGSLPAGALRHPDRGLHPQRRAAQPVAGGHLRRAAGHRAAACREPAAARARGRRGGSRPRPRVSRSAATWPRTPACRGSCDELELPLIPVLADMEATGVAIDRAALGELVRTSSATEIARLEEEIFESVGHRVQPGQPQAAGAGPVLRAGPAARQAHQDRLLDRRVGARGPPAGAPDDRHAARLAAVHQAALHLRRRAAAAARPAHGPPAHHLPAGGRGDRAALVDRPEPPEHPHPHRAGAQDPPRVRRRRARTRAAGRRLQPDRAAHPGPRVGRRAPQGGLRAARRHPPRDGRAGAQEGPRRRDGRRALDGQDGQLRPGLRHERLRPVDARGHPARARRRTSSPATSRPTAASATTCSTSRRPPSSRATWRRCWVGGAGSRSWRRATRRCAARASGWPSTCPSRAPPRTS